MRVLLFSDADVFAGTERHMFDLARGLIAEGVEASIASPTPSALKDHADAAGIRHVAIQKNGLVDRAAVAALSAMLKSGEIDVVHAHNGRTMLSSALAVTVARKGTAVATQHFLEPDHATKKGPKAAMFALAHHWVSARLSRYIAISEAVRESMLHRNEAPANKITVVPNGMHPIDRAKLAPSSDLRQLLGVPDDEVMILCAARLEREKDVTSLITAMQSAVRTMPRVRCLIAGQGSLQSALQAQIDTLGLAGNVALLGFRKDILSLINACDLFILPSLAEPFGLVLLEAMALGKPVIATDAGGPREIVVNGSSGILTPPSDPSSLASAIVTICSESGELQRMGKNGFDRFTEMFTAERMSRSMIIVYHDAVGGSRS